MARPRIEIDKKQFENLCGLQCTLIEIADFFDCSEDTVERWCKRTYNESFADIFSKKRNKGKISLRRLQFKLAEKNASMAIFLGKQFLDQKENFNVDLTKPIEETAKEMEDYFFGEGENSRASKE